MTRVGQTAAMRALLVGTALAVTIAATACSDKSDPVTIDDPGTTTTTTAEPADGCAADDKNADEMISLTVEAVPEGFELQPDDVGDTGPSNLDKAASDDGEDDAERTLTDLKFRRGYQWLWATAAEEQIVSFVYEFCNGAGARGYLERGQEIVAADPVEPVVFDVPELEGEVAFAGEDQGSAVAVVDMVDGPYYVRIFAYATAGSLPADALNARAGAVMVAQLEQL